MTTNTEPVIGNNPPNDGNQWECQCARCGSSLDFVSCSACDGEGRTALGQLYEEDPLWYDPEDTEPCCQCGGEASWPVCLSSEEWCKEHPIEGRENIERGQVEWFCVKVFKP